MTTRRAFTLLEVLISIALLGILLPALFSVVDMLQDSNQQLLKYLKKTTKTTKATEVLYLDILSSDANISIIKDEFTRLCIEETTNSLYALPTAKVCWVVLKKKKTLARVEGNDYLLPLRDKDRVEVDPIMSNMRVFDVYKSKDKILILLQQEGKKPITFMIQGIIK